MFRLIASCFGVLLLVPIWAQAQWDVNRNRLDDERIETIPLPVLFGVELDQVIPDFGAPRGGGTRQHEGQDFMVPGGTPIVSPTEAIVIRTGRGTSAGNYIYTANPGGETFRYMHLAEVVDLEHGDRVAVGDYLGTVGDTGNAEDGSYHLHFEMRDQRNRAQDPYPRLGEAFTVKEKMSFLPDLFRSIRNDREYAEFLVATFPNDFITALEADYDLPRVIERVIESTGLNDRHEQQVALIELVATIPAVLNQRIETGNQGPLVQLLQLYVILTSDGMARDRLAAAGPTGYYGPITAAAVRALQAEIGVVETGEYDARTQRALLGRRIVSIGL
jgi:hypothetical protein